MGSRVAIAALDVLEDEKIAENSYILGELFRKELESRINKRIVNLVRGKGLMNAIIINSSKYLSLLVSILTCGPIFKILSLNKTCNSLYKILHIGCLRKVSALGLVILLF